MFKEFVAQIGWNAVEDEVAELVVVGKLREPFEREAVGVGREEGDEKEEGVAT